VSAQTIHEPKRQGGYTWANDAPDADRECGKRRQYHQRKCGACKRTVMVHCDQCLIQVTGCLCTLIERMGPVEAYKTLARQVGQRDAQAAFKSFGYNLPYLPGIPD
jgi:hypothetical protein